jgi:hypothetical protein
MHNTVGAQVENGRYMRDVTHNVAFIQYSTVRVPAVATHRGADSRPDMGASYTDGR